MTVTSLEFLTQKDIDAFWKKVRSSENTEICWLWSGHASFDGYGVFSRKRINEPRIAMRTHRLAYILTNGEIPVKAPMVRHKCDVRLCCNPNHLEVGTAEQNARDIVDRGKHWTQLRPDKIIKGTDHWSVQQPALVPRGEASGQSKLTQQQVDEIRQRYANEPISQRKLAKEYSVTQGAIWQILNNNHWKVL